MECILHFLNENQGALMVIITAIYVIATIRICRANKQSAEASKEQAKAAKDQTESMKDQLEEMEREYKETQRLQMMPYFEIMVHDDIRDFVECIGLAISDRKAENSTVIDRRVSIKNIGLGVAKDFTYTWCNLDGSYHRNDLDFTAFAPGDEKSIYFDFYAEHKDDFSEYEAPVSIVFTYRDLLENKYNVEFKMLFIIAGDGDVEIKNCSIGIPIVVKE